MCLYVRVYVHACVCVCARVRAFIALVDLQTPDKSQDLDSTFFLSPPHPPLYVCKQGIGKSHLPDKSHDHDASLTSSSSSSPDRISPPKKIPPAKVDILKSQPIGSFYEGHFIW